MFIEENLKQLAADAVAKHPSGISVCQDEPDPRFAAAATSCRWEIRPGRHRDERRVFHRMLMNAYHSLSCQISAAWRSCRESLLFAIFSRSSTMLSKAWGNDSQRE